MEFQKPCHLADGDTVAVLSPSWGGPHAYPGIFDAGLAQLRRLGLTVREYPSTRWSETELYGNPQQRARDLTDAFGDPEVKAIFASIGGDDCVRLLPHLDWDAIRANPTILMGYSDTTALLAAINLQGLVTFHGPSVMAGIAQLDAFPNRATHLKRMLFEHTAGLVFEELESYSEGYPDWSRPELLGQVLEPQPAAGWRWLQGEGVVQGTLFGGCIEVLEFLKATEYWPEVEFWNDKILFLETSEEKPSVAQVKRWLRNYGMQGVFDRASALLFGRAKAYTDEEKEALEQAILEVIGVEFGAPAFPVVANMDFGHTDPQHILPLGVAAVLDFESSVFRLNEAATAAR